MVRINYKPRLVKVEICVDSVESALAAQSGGADRVELCDNFMEGGTTPSIGSVKVARKRLELGLQVIIRPRGGDFLYSEIEFESMKEDILACKENGVDGVVIGLLTHDGQIDLGRTKELVELARPLNVTFHRAFDMCVDPMVGLEQLIEAGISRILTSGQEASVVEGLELLTELNQKAAGRIIIMPGGGITQRNVARVVKESGVSEIHFAAQKVARSGMAFRNARVYMGGTLRPPEYDRETTDHEAVRSIIATAG